MPPCTTLHTPLRRPCLLRSVLESNIDAPEGKRASLSPEKRNVAKTSGASGPDYRTLTLDMPSRLSPRCSGLHRGSLGSPVDAQKESKPDHWRAQQALGFVPNFDLDPNTMRSHRQQSLDSPSRRRTKIEELRGMPLSGKGADISAVSGRRCEGTRNARSQERSPHQDKTELNGVSICHQFSRRRFSAPPESRSCEGFNARVVAEGFANLLGRPQGSGKRELSPPGSPLHTQPFRVPNTHKNGSLFYYNPYLRRTASAKELGSYYNYCDEPASRERALSRERRSNWSPPSPNLPSRSLELIMAETARLEAAAADSSQSRLRAGSPVKSQRQCPPEQDSLNFQDSPPARNRRQSAPGSLQSDISPMSASTQEPEGFSITPNTSSVLSSTPATPSRRFRSSRMSICRTVNDEQWKARRRAGWSA